MNVIKSSFSINWNTFERVLDDLSDLSYFNPSMEILSIQLNIKCHELMIWTVVDSKLDSFLDHIFTWPESTEKFSINLNSSNFLILFLYILLHNWKTIVKSIDQNRGRKEIFLKIRSNILNRNWNLVRDKISSSSILDEISLEVINNREVGTMNLLSCYPENIRLVKICIKDIFSEFGVGWEFNGRVTIELLEIMLWLLHSNVD